MYIYIYDAYEYNYAHDTIKSLICFMLIVGDWIDCLWVTQA